MSSGPSGPPSAQLPRPGDVVGGKYVLQSMIGQGGMGAVFKARHMELEHEVAIKVMFADAGNVEAATRFKNEGRAAARIKSDHVMKVHDVGQEFNYLYMVLELLEGQDLAQLLESNPNGKLPWTDVVKYVLEGLEGVEKAHQLGIVHRDLKPSNLYLSKEKDHDGTDHTTVKVLDFGISKASSGGALSQSPSALTSTKAMLGSPLYMSPEQLRSSKSVDARADIWAIGVILYELITGTLPFMGDNLGELFANILETDAASLNTRGGNVPEVLDQIVLKCLKRRPEDRWQTVRELINALRQVEHASPLAGTAFMAQSPMRPGAHGPMAGFASTPQPRPMPPAAGAITGNGSAPRSVQQVQGTVALGQTPPGGAVPHQHQPQQQPFPGAGVSTNSSWQAEPVVPTTKPPIGIIAAVLGGLAIVGLVAGIAVSKMKKDPDATNANPPPSASIAAPLPTPTPTETTATPTPSATTSAAPSATTVALTPTTTSAPVQPAVHVPVKPPPPQQPVAKIEPPKPADPPKSTAPPPTATTKPTTTGGGVGVTTRN